VISDTGSFSLTENGVASACLGTLTLVITEPPPTDANVAADTTARVTGSFSFSACSGATSGSADVGKPIAASVDASGKGVTVGTFPTGLGPVDGFLGRVTGGGTQLGYVQGRGGAVIAGTLGTGNALCPTIQLPDTKLL
jgi:hypothetical protein